MRSGDSSPNSELKKNGDLNLDMMCLGVSQVATVIKNLAANAGNIRDSGSIPESGRSPEEGNGNPLQYSRLKNPMDRGAWQAMVHRVARSQT